MGIFLKLQVAKLNIKCIKFLFQMQVLAFGDSFVKMFLHCRPTVRFRKFKGKSIKGIVKEHDEQHALVEQQIKKFPKVKKILFFFGQVDFNYVRYYKLIHQEPRLTQQTFREYVKWVASMNKYKNIAIVSIFPSPVKQDHIIGSLTSKVSYPYEKHCPENDSKILEQYKKSAETWYKWNGWIKKYCEIYKVRNICLFDKYEVPEEFIDLSNLNIHLRYVPVLKLVSKHVDIKFDEKKAEEIEKEYEQDKVNRIQETITRMAQMRQQASETTTQQEEGLQNKGSTSQQYESSSQTSSRGQIKSDKEQDPQSNEGFLRPIRKKTVQVIASSKNQQSDEMETKPEIARWKSSKQPVQTKKQEKQEEEQQNSQSQSSSDDEAERFYNMAFGARSKS